MIRKIDRRSIDKIDWPSVANHRSKKKLAIKEAVRFKLAGGCTIVEMSSIGLSRDPLGLARISRATGLNIIMGTGFYLGASQSPAGPSGKPFPIVLGIFCAANDAVSNHDNNRAQFHQ